MNNVKTISVKIKYYKNSYQKCFKIVFYFHIEIVICPSLCKSIGIHYFLYNNTKINKN